VEYEFGIEVDAWGIGLDDGIDDEVYDADVVKDLTGSVRLLLGFACGCCCGYVF